MTAHAPAAARWFVGPATDLLLGCGLAYAGLLLVFLAFGDVFLAATPAFLAPLLILLFSFPHYGATLLRVYAERQQRRRYAFFALWATLAIVGWFVGSLYVPLLGSLLLTLYVSWSPWHYTGQNFGIAVAFLRRRGVALDGSVRRALHLSFVCSFLLFFGAMHETASWAVSRRLPLEGEGLRFLALGISPWFTTLAAIGYAVSTLWAGIGLARRAPLGELLPAALLVLSQALWFAVPAAVRHWGGQPGGPFDPAQGVLFFYWIAVAHSVQYLWITRFYAKGSAADAQPVPYFGRTFLAGTALWTLPFVVFSPGLSGGVSLEAGLALLVASAINVHHFVLDGAIWKLRDGPVARILIRDGGPDADAASAPGPSRAGWASAVWGTAALGSLLAVGVYAIEQHVLPAAVARSDAPAASRWLGTLAWLGREPASGRATAAQLYLRAGDQRSAILELERSVTAQPATLRFGALVELLLSEGRDEEAAEWAQRMVDFAPEDRAALELAARAFAQAGRAEDARTMQARARALAAAPAGARAPEGRALVY
ncbi:MAG: hypothetical protein AAF430_07110 [Myxococcota bacterium]